MAQSAGAVEYTDYTSAEGQGSPNDCSGYDTKQSNVKASVILELWGMRSNPLLLSLPDQLLLGVVAPDRILSMDQIKLTDRRLNWVLTNAKIKFFEMQMFNHLTVCKQITDA